MSQAATIPTPPDQLVSKLAQLLNVEELDTDLYRGARTHEPWRRVFGGQVIAQALMAACRTVDPARKVHSLHGYFMRPGDPSRPILFEVARDRDGGSFSTRRVVALQGGTPILNLAASFHIEEAGLSHQMEMPDVPAPEMLEDDRTVIARELHRVPEARRGIVLRERPIEFRPVDPGVRMSAIGAPPRQAYWLRAVAPLPDDPLLHRVMLAYASDMMLLATSLVPHGVNWLTDDLQEASLDHALWIHADVRLDDWLLYDLDSPWSGGARGFNRGRFFTRDGTLVASVAQEGLIRMPAGRR